MQGLWMDVRLAARRLAKDRRFTVAAVVALGLGIGLSTSVFAIVNAAFLRPLPFDEPHRLVAAQLRDRRGSIVAASYADLRDWRSQTSTFEGLAAHSPSAMNLSDDGRAAERYGGSYVTGNTFRVLRVAPILGRNFVDEDDQPGAAAGVMLGYPLWQTRYGGDPSVVGRSVRVNDIPATIIGVMPSGFKYPFIDQLWLPLSAAPAFVTATRSTRALSVVGRLAPGVELPRARAELDAVVRRLAIEHPASNKDLTLLARPLREIYPLPPTPMVATMIGAVGFVLLIAYANLANLLLARSVERAREIAVRVAVGATRFRIVCQVLIECLLVALAGGALGLGLSIYGANEIAVAFEPIQAGVTLGTNRPYWVNVTPNAMVYAFVGLLSIASAFAFGALPAWHVAKTAVSETLKEEGRAGGGSVRRRRWSAALLTAELALTLVLLTGAGLLVRGFIERYREPTVIDTSEVVLMRVAPSPQKYSTAADRKRFLEQLQQRLSSITALSAVTMANHVPMEFGAPARELFIDGLTIAPGEKPPMVSYVLTGARYFETLKLPVVRGRPLAPQDGMPGQEGAVVDERFVSRFFPDRDPIGRRIRAGATRVSLTIVGVARTVPQAGPPQEVRPIVYAPFAAEPAPEGRLAIIVKGPLTPAAATLRAEVAALDPRLPVFAIETLEAARARGRLPARLVSTWFGILAGVALVLAAVGVFAITAHNVAQRTHEIGVRMALGAEARDVLHLFVRRTLRQLVVALSIGLATTFALGRLLQSSLEDVSPRDPLTLVAVIAVLVVVAMTATLLPARRAARLDPVVALRAE